MFGKYIKQARLLAGKTQKEVSNETKLPQPTISWIENDKGIANIYDCVLLAKCYGITIDELIGNENKNNIY